MSKTVEKDLEQLYKIVPIEDCIPNEWNPNKMPEMEFSKLSDDIDRVGDNKQHPILVRPHPEQKGKFQIVDGFHRWTAMKGLGFDEIIVNIQNLDEKDARIKTITSNKFRGEPDQILMGELLISLKNDYGMSNEEIEGIIGYSDAEIKTFEDMIGFDFENYIKEEAIPHIDTNEDLPIDFSLNLTGGQLACIEEAIKGLKDLTKGNHSNAEAIATLCAYFSLMQEDGLIDTSVVMQALDKSKEEVETIAGMKAPSNEQIDEFAEEDLDGLFED